MATRAIYLPAQFAIDASVADNPVQQLRHPAYAGEAEVEPYAADGVRGERVVLPTGTVLVVARGTPDGTRDARVLQLRGGTAPTGLADLHARRRGVRWLSPIPEEVATQDREAWRRRREAVRASWDGQFVFKEERREGDQVVEKGLRPPQIGAVYGVLSHWKVTQEPSDGEGGSPATAYSGA